MKTFKMSTDASMRSTLQYGTSAFRFDSCIDELDKDENPSVGWHWHNLFEFSVIISGTIHCLIQNQDLTLTTGDCIFLNSGSIHSFTTPHHGELFHIFFAPEFIAPEPSDLYDQYVRPVLSSDMKYYILHINDDEESYLCDLIGDIFRIANSPEERFHLYIRVLTMWEIFFPHIKQDLKPTECTKANKITQIRLQKMLDFIHHQYHTHLSLNDIAASANISQSEASRCFKSDVQTTPINYLNDYRLNKARELLQTTCDSITDIALNVGFDNPGYFCKSFKKKYHHSPKEMRKTLK